MKYLKIKILVLSLLFSAVSDATVVTLGIFTLDNGWRNALNKSCKSEGVGDLMACITMFLLDESHQDILNSLSERGVLKNVNEKLNSESGFELSNLQLDIPDDLIAKYGEAEITNVLTKYISISK